MLKRIRDVYLTPLTQESALAIACDSCGGIGMLPNDQVQVPSYYVGYFTAIVALSELVCLGGDLLSIVDTLSIPYVGEGEAIIEGIQHALNQLGVLHKEVITGSTEENIPVSQTAIGVTAIGTLSYALLDTYQTKSRDSIYVIGYPKMGSTLVTEEIVNHRGEIATLPLMLALRQHPKIHEMIPVGSKGIAYELTQLRFPSDTPLQLKKVAHPLDEYASGGPATCIILSADSDLDITKLPLGTCPITYLGHMDDLA